MHEEVLYRLERQNSLIWTIRLYEQYKRFKQYFSKFSFKYVLRVEVIRGVIVLPFRTLN